MEPGLSEDRSELRYAFDAHQEHTGIPALLRRLDELGLNYRDLNTSQSTLEEIFVNLVNGPGGARA